MKYQSAEALNAHRVWDPAGPDRAPAVEGQDVAAGRCVTARELLGGTGDPASQFAQPERGGAQ